MRKRAGRNFHTAREFVQYLKRTLIPDLMRSGMRETARDFEKAALLIERGKRDVSFIGFLKRTLIPDLYDSGSEQTAYDFGEAVEWMERGAVMASTNISEELVKVAKELVAEEAPGFGAALGDFLAYCQKMIDDYMAENFPTNPKATLQATTGGRWVKIIKVDTQRSAWAFVDRTNGDVMKPAGWNAPAKHARANIFDKSTWKNVGVYGPNYLR